MIDADVYDDYTCEKNLQETAEDIGGRLKSLLKKGVCKQKGFLEKSRKILCFALIFFVKSV